MLTQVRRWLPLLLVITGLSLVALVAAGPGLTGGRVPPTPPLPDERGIAPRSPTPAATPTPPAEEPPAASANETVLDALVWGYIAVVMLALVAVVGYLLYRAIYQLFTERPELGAIRDQAASQPDAEDDALREQARDAVRASLADLDAGGDPRRAVIACWLRLERMAWQAGTAREAADTPADLVARMLARHRVSAEALADLADAYRQARYAPAEVDELHVDMARRCLQTIDRQLATAGVLR